ncbi:predicted protein [Nematostella vectensis]|uniref:Mitochondrial inner membrane protease ATP23 n=1 Tax=Nematostella vectensis TaxID=45351 RepID=A7T801_NEMVE|nr:predicted protein [Nematostella vectensis]|eukprot:XP_001619994.1 hypothetical protein NEMVEDRAFT_v1g223597 [Nematostella vectensis]
MADVGEVSSDQGKSYDRAEHRLNTDQKQHRICLERVERAKEQSSYVRFMLNAMSKLGCNIDDAKHIVCEPCNGKLLGGFDPDKKEMFLCENTIYNQQAMDDVLTHELIHAYDYCRVKYDPDNLKHLACTEGLAFRRGSHQLFSASHDKTVKIWNLDEMAYVETLFGHQDAVTGIDSLSRDRAATAGGRDRTLRIWKVVEESQLVFNGAG